MGDWWKTIYDRFWFLRGVVAAYSFTALATTSLDWERFPFLRVIHFSILQWNKVTHLFSKFIQETLPFIQLTSGHVSALILVSVLTFPSLLVGYAPNQSFLYKIRYLLGFLFSIGVMIFWGGDTFDSYQNPLLALILLAPILYPQAKVLVIEKRGYGQGIVTAIGFLITLEALYLLSTPTLKSVLDQWACSNSGQSREICDQPAGAPPVRP